MQQEEIYEEKPTEQKANIYFGLISGVAVPLAIAIASGVLAAFVIALVVNIASDFVTGLAGYNASIASIAGAIVTGLVWWGEIGQRRVNIKNSFIQLIEIATQQEINGGGIGASPEPEKRTIVFREKSEDGMRRRDYSTDITDDEIVIISKKTVEGARFSMTEYVKGSNNIFTETRFKEIREQFIESKFIIKDFPKQINSPYSWTNRGFEAMSEEAVS